MISLARKTIALLALGAAATASASGTAPRGTEGSNATAQSQLAKGFNYAETRTTDAVIANDVLARAEQHRAAMNAGRNYAEAPRGDAAVQVASVMEQAHRHELAMARGLDHEDARAAARAAR